MRRGILLSAGIALVATAVALGQSRAPARAWTPETFSIAPFASKVTKFPCERGQDARIVVSGSGACALGVYVFDPSGQCIGHDDEPGLGADDRVVAWTAAEKGAYTIEIRSLGPVFNFVEANAR